ncbi:MAG: hypothetical protein SVR08_10825, partial [Spirochaetota bacterium]|nr:hypothetical protein [Spirochaetota bacterium]
GGVIAQLTMGVNLRTQSKWFGVKLYAGLGFFGGNMTLYSSYYNEWAEEMQLYETDFDVDYSTFYYSIGVELPMGAGEKFCGPFIEITILPTPGSKDIRKAIEDEYGYYEGESPEMEEGSVVMLAFGFSHYW